VPVFLAGGLNPSNVAEAIDLVGPFGVDVCSGVRRDGKLNEELLAGFFRAVDAWSSARMVHAAASPLSPS
jgi:phosphoribosylanthranilate isomerase